MSEKNFWLLLIAKSFLFFLIVSAITLSSFKNSLARLISPVDVIAADNPSALNLQPLFLNIKMAARNFIFLDSNYPIPNELADNLNTDDDFISSLQNKFNGNKSLRDVLTELKNNPRSAAEKLSQLSNESNESGAWAAIYLLNNVINNNQPIPSKLIEKAKLIVSENSFKPIIISEASFLLAKIDYQNKKYQQVIDTYQNWLTGKNHLDFFFKLDYLAALSFFKNRDYEKQLKIVNQLLNNFPFSKWYPYLIKQKADNSFAQGAYFAAVEQYNAIAQKINVKKQLIWAYYLAADSQNLKVQLKSNSNSLDNNEREFFNFYSQLQSASPKDIAASYLKIQDKDLKEAALILLAQNYDFLAKDYNKLFTVNTKNEELIKSIKWRNIVQKITLNEYAAALDLIDKFPKLSSTEILIANYNKALVYYAQANSDIAIGLLENNTTAEKNDKNIADFRAKNLFALYYFLSEQNNFQKILNHDASQNLNDNAVNYLVALALLKNGNTAAGQQRVASNWFLTGDRESLNLSLYFGLQYNLLDYVNQLYDSAKQANIELNGNDLKYYAAEQLKNNQLDKLADLKLKQDSPINLTLRYMNNNFAGVAKAIKKNNYYDYFLSGAANYQLSEFNAASSDFAKSKYLNTNSNQKIAAEINFWQAENPGSDTIDKDLMALKTSSSILQFAILKNAIGFYQEQGKFNLAENLIADFIKQYPQSTYPIWEERANNARMAGYFSQCLEFLNESFYSKISANNQIDNFLIKAKCQLRLNNIKQIAEELNTLPAINYKNNEMLAVANFISKRIDFQILDKMDDPFFADLQKLTNLYSVDDEITEFNEPEVNYQLALLFQKKGKINPAYNLLLKVVYLFDIEPDLADYRLLSSLAEQAGKKQDSLALKSKIAKKE